MMSGPDSAHLGVPMTNKYDEEQAGRVKTVRTKPRRTYHELQGLKKRKKPNRDQQRTDKRGEE
jgi:hypothetical protein